MTPDRLAELKSWAIWTRNADVLELVAEVERQRAERDAARAEVRRLTDGIAALADECEKVPPANEAMNAWQRAHAAFAGALRALLTAPTTPTEETGE